MTSTSTRSLSSRSSSDISVTPRESRAPSGMISWNSKSSTMENRVAGSKLPKFPSVRISAPIRSSTVILTSVELSRSPNRIDPVPSSPTSMSSACSRDTRVIEVSRSNSSSERNPISIESVRECSRRVSKLFRFKKSASEASCTAWVTSSMSSAARRSSSETSTSSEASRLPREIWGSPSESRAPAVITPALSRSPMFRRA